MNIQQFQYLLAVVDSKNFEAAAERCFVTQSTLSTMINKFEDEIGIKIFNRKTKPVTITKEGQQIITRLRIITNEIDLLNNVVQEIKGEMVGEIKIGIIPTIAPNLLPRFINEYAARFKKVNILIKEMTTEQIQRSLLARDIDVGILALPLNHKEIKELSLYNEPFLIYDCTGIERTDTISPDDLDYSKICLLEEGHCLRTQVYDICELARQHFDSNVNYKFESGSMESLIRITQSRQGITILPYLSYYSLSQETKKNVIQFREPVPVREIGIVTHRFFVKKALLEGLEEIIKKSVNTLIPKIDSIRVIQPI